MIWTAITALVLAQVTAPTPVNLFSGAQVNLIEEGQLVLQLQVTVTGLKDGADEKLIVDGTEVPLQAGTVVTTNGFSVLTALTSTGPTTPNNVADVKITKPPSGFTPAECETLVNNLQYLNSALNPRGTSRAVALYSIQDNGGTANGGVDTGFLSVVSTVTIVPINDPPILLANPLDPEFREAPKGNQ